LAKLLSYGNIGFLVAALDLAVITLSSLAADSAYHYFVLGSQVDLAALLGIGMNSGLLFGLISASRGHYQARDLLSAKKRANGIVSSWISVLLIMTALLFLLKVGSDYSRGSMLIFGLLGLPLLLATRALVCKELSRLLTTGALSGPRCVLVGDQEELRELAALELLQNFGVREVSRFEFPPVAEPDDDTHLVDSAIAAARKTNAEQIVLALSWVDTRRRDFLVKMLRILPLPVLLLPDRAVRRVFLQAGAELKLLELRRAPLSKVELAAKRTLDLVSAGAGLVVLLPLLAVVSLAIKLDSPGPVIFRQSRRGFNGHEFMIWKFQTMTVAENGRVIYQAKRNDERVTRVGRLLRATSIDELPQLVNVLRGEMSLVGPRPHAIAHDDEYGRSIGKYAFRHHVKPGITGWAQVNGFRGGLGLWVGHLMRGELGLGRQNAETFLREAERRARMTECGVGRRLVGLTCLWRGDFIEAQANFVEALSICDPERDREAMLRFDRDIGATTRACLANTKWQLGEVGPARALIEEAVAHAIETGHGTYPGQRLFPQGPLRDSSW
jgi:undecaprenyl-phosphate galactose phosphotransferase/putative colanic acid biosynthesis UDP-glucose lipid carrier transferase